MRPDPNDFTRTFPDERSCIAFLERIKWPDGIIRSPFAPSEAYRISTRPGIYKCKETRQTFSVRHGTIFEESRLGLRKWFFTIFLVSTNRQSVSSIQIAKSIGVTQKTAWFMLNRIRFAVEHEDFQKPLEPAVSAVVSESLPFENRSPSPLKKNQVSRSWLTSPPAPRTPN
jgi:transposase-like protein